MCSSRSRLLRPQRLFDPFACSPYSFVTRSESLAYRVERVPGSTRQMSSKTSCCSPSIRHPDCGSSPGAAHWIVPCAAPPATSCCCSASSPNAFWRRPVGPGDSKPAPAEQQALPVQRAGVSLGARPYLLTSTHLRLGRERNARSGLFHLCSQRLHFSLDLLPGLLRLIDQPLFISPRPQTVRRLALLLRNDPPQLLQFSHPLAQLRRPFLLGVVPLALERQNLVAQVRYFCLGPSFRFG